MPRPADTFARMLLTAIVAGALLPAASALAAGVLTVATSAAPTFSANVDTGDQTRTYTIPLTVTDTRGTGAGWNLTITSTQLKTATHRLSATASTITGVTVACATPPCVTPANSITYPVNLPAAAVAPAAVKFYNAGLTTGLGTFTVTPTTSVVVPQNSYAGSYASTVTISVVSGP